MVVRYVPALHDKQAEVFALAELPAGRRAETLPLLTIRDPQPGPTTRRWNRDRALRLKVRDPDRGIVGYWGHEHPVLVDLSALRPQPGDRVHPAHDFLDWSSTLGVPVVPVVEPGAPDDYRRVVRSWCRRSDGGGGVRARPWPPASRPSPLRTLLRELGAARDRLDLIVDLGCRAGAVRACDPGEIEALLRGIGPLTAWRRVTLLGGSFPPALWDRMGHDDRARFGRYEQRLYEQVTSAAFSPDHLVFGDYGVVATGSAFPRRGAATIRYTTPRHWLVLRGHPPAKAPTGEHARLAHELMASDEWRGDDHCTGCAAIARRARQDGPGGATAWRQADFSHHFACVHEIRSDRAVHGAAS